MIIIFVVFYNNFSLCYLLNFVYQEVLWYTIVYCHKHTLVQKAEMDEFRISSNKGFYQQ